MLATPPKSWLPATICQVIMFISVVLLVKKILMLDQNINVQKQSLKATANIINGLRKNFQNGAKIIFPLLIDKLKDKKITEDV